MDNLNNNNAVETRDYEDELTLFVKDVFNISTGCYSRKVFVGGLPPDIDEDKILESFKWYGSVRVDWPHKFDSNARSPPKGYAFLLFKDEVSVHKLLKACESDGEKYFTFISSMVVKNKRVQIRPWRFEDTDCLLSPDVPLDPRKTLFVGGVPRPCTANKLAQIMENTFGDICYVGIDTDPEFKYPKGSARVTFKSHKIYIKAISSRFVQLNVGEINKTVEVKPYVLDDQECDFCRGKNCNDKVAQFFCANITCLKYYCDQCWTFVHTADNKQFHKPLVKESSDKNKMPILQ